MAEVLAPSYRKTSTKEKVAVARLLGFHLIANGDGSFSYMEGWNDERIGMEAIPDYPGSKVSAVQHVRAEVYGELKKLPKVPPTNWELLERVEMLEHSIKNLIDDIQARRDFLAAK